MRYRIALLMIALSVCALSAGRVTAQSGEVPYIAYPRSVATIGPQAPDDKDKGNKDDRQKILQLLADGKLTVAEAYAKLAEKPEEKKDEKKEENKWKLLPEGWNFHAQATIVPEFQAGFPAKYTGPNSLSPNL
jgi:hypothetical protein